MNAVRRWVDEWRPSAVTMGAPVFPLLVLFGLNAVDELDRAAFAVLLPNIRDHFGLTTKEALALVSFTTIAVLLIEIPLSFYADRRNRVRIATIGAGIWGLFSIGTGFSTSVGMLAGMRVGAGGGRAVVTPTHSGLLSDYYRPETRVKVFSFHRQANSVGLILGPLIGGLLGKYFGWRAPFFVFAIPTFFFLILALRLKEPVRGFYEKQAAGTEGVEEPPAGVRESFKILYNVRTIRRIWMALPFLAIALFGVSSLLSIVYKDVFNVDEAGRGIIAAVIEPLQIFGVFFAMPRIAKIAMKDPGFLLRLVAAVGVFNGIVLVALAYAPNLAIAVVCNALVSGSIGVLAPAFFAMLSILAPPRVRSVTFSTISIFGIPGIALGLPLIGALSDKYGPQVSITVMVPVTLIAGFILATAYKFVNDDIAKVHGANAFAGAAAAADLQVAEEVAATE